MHANLKSLAAMACLCVLSGATGALAQSPAADSLLVDLPLSAAPLPPQPPAAIRPATAAPAASPVNAPVAAESKNSKPAPETETAPRIIPLPTDSKGPDESALRYYASLQQTQRAEIEIKRLQRLYPDWQPPENIFNTPAAGSVDEQPFWDLFALGKLDEVRADIDKRMIKEPGWQPSPDLLDKMKRKQSRLSITALWKSGKWKDLIAFVRGNGDSVGDDSDVDILWTVAEAYAKIKQTPDALKIYKSIMKNNREPEQRLATVQKAMSVLRMSDVEELIAMARRDSRGRSELDSIAIDITRGRISSFLHDERTEPLPEDELKSFEAYARRNNDPNQHGLVAWYYYKTKVFTQSLEWFKAAIVKGGDSMIAHGLAHSLRELGMYRETEEVAYAWRQPLVNNAILFIDSLERDLTKEIPPNIEPDRLMRYAQVTMDNASGEGAQGLAWYAYNSCQFKVAHEWFERAVAWLPKEATVYGYALTLQKLKKTKEFWETLNRYDGLFPKVIDIVYPDDLYHPPTPCDLMENKGQQRPRTQAQPAYTVPAPYLAGQPYAAAPYAAAPPAAVAYGGTPASAAPPAPAGQPAPQPHVQNTYIQPQAMPVQGQGGYYQNPALAHRREPQIDRKNFPVSADPQNPLRFYPTGRYMGAQAPAASSMIAPASAVINEPPMGMRQLVARRVPDVARMPYERWGYTLLPAYNGLTAASDPHSSEKAPAGTLWTTLYAKDAVASRGSAFDPLRQDINALTQRMTSIPRVPPPAASINGPWKSPPPYKSREQLESEGLLPPANASAGPAEIIASPSLTPAATTLPSQAIAPVAAGAPSAAARSLPLLATNPPAGSGASNHRGR